MKKVLIYCLILFNFLFCLPFELAAQIFRSLPSLDGLDNLTVNTFCKDSVGFVWIGTDCSVERFDGVFFKHYEISEEDEQLKSVNAIVEMDSHIWMGNGKGLWRLDKQSDTFELVVSDLINSPVYSLLDDGKGTLYIGSERGLYFYNKGVFKHLLLDINIFSSSNVIVEMSMDKEDNLWMATSKGLYALNINTHKLRHWHYKSSNGVELSFNCLARVKEKLYLGTMSQGIICFDIPSETFSSFVTVGCNVISSLSSDAERMLYVGTDGNGIHFIDTNKRKVIRSMRHEVGNENSLRSNSVYSLMIDREGLIWVGFYQAGFDYSLFQANTFSVYSFPPYFTSKDILIRAIAINGDEKLVGSRDGLFYIDEGKNRFHVFGVPQMRSGMIFCIRYFEGKYCIGTYGGGMYVIDPRTLEINDFGIEEPFQNGHVFCMTEDDTHTLWIGTSMGIFCYKKGKIQAHYTSTNSKLPEGNVYEIFFDSSGKGWICTENGMCLWDPSSRRLRTDIFPEGFIHKEKIRVVYEDSDCQLYFFPDKGTLFISDLSMNLFYRLQPRTPLEGRDGVCIIEDCDKRLWMGTKNGLFCYNRENDFVVYNFADGIPSPVFTLCPPVCDEYGNLWFGNSKGLLFLDKSHAKEKKGEDYVMRITDVLVNGNTSVVWHGGLFGSNSKIQLKSFERNLKFRISDFSYTEPTTIYYEYMLEGIDKGWLPLLGKSEASYYNLPSGTYIFKVRKVGQPNSEVNLPVCISSDFPVGLTISLSLIILVVGVGWYYFFYRRKKIIAKVPIAQTAIESVQETVSDEKYKSIKVSVEECQRLSKILEDKILNEKLYIRSDLKLADLAKAVGTSTHTLSYLFNQYLECSYYDYINDYRIAEFKRLVNTNEYERYTLSALAELCGFSSRASFFRYFKKAMGITPNEYIHNVSKNNE